MDTVIDDVIIEFPAKYKKYITGHYNGFSTGGVAYDLNRMKRDRIKPPEPMKIKDAPLLMQKLDPKKKRDRDLIVALISKNFKENVATNLLFLGTAKGEYDSTIYGWTQIYRQDKFVSILVYSLTEVLKALQKDMNWNNAHEYWEFNMLEAWMGLYTPIYYYKKSDDIYANFVKDSKIRSE